MYRAFRLVEEFYDFDPGTVPESITTILNGNDNLSQFSLNQVYYFYGQLQLNLIVSVNSVRQTVS